MGNSNHWSDCWRMHYPCALHRIHELEVKVQTLTTQLQYERTGHLTGSVFAEPRMGEPAPCHDHIEPPIVSGGPTWAHRPDEPPSLTP